MKKFISMNDETAIRLFVILFFISLVLPGYSMASEDKYHEPESCELPNIYERLLRTNIPEEWKQYMNAAKDSPREELIIPDDCNIIYVVSAGWTVAIVLLDDEFNIKDVKYFPARSGGFSVSWYQGLVVTVHNHPGTGMFYHKPMHVSVKNNQLLIKDATVGWPARHADNE